MAKPMYKEEFADFDDLTDLLAQLPVTFCDHSWHHDSCPNFQYSVTADCSGVKDFPRLVLWVDYADRAKRECGRERFILMLVRCEDEHFNGKALVLRESEEITPVIDAIQRILGDGISMKLYMSPNCEGYPWLHLSHGGTAVFNPFISECGRFNASPTAYGLNFDTASIFLRSMPVDQLRDVMSSAIGNADVFDACATEEEKLAFAIEYLAEVLTHQPDNDAEDVNTRI